MVFSFSYEHWRVLSRIPHTLTCYFCIDEWSGFKWVSKRRVICEENQMIENADIVIASSKFVQRRRSNMRKAIHHVPNGVLVELYRTATLAETDIPDDIERIPSPRLGIVGNINETLDSGVIHGIAVMKPDWSIIFVGPVSMRLWGRFSPEYRRLQKLKKLPNVHFLGARPHEQLPRYLKGFDVCLVPYELDAVGKGRDPIKVYEYMAAGKPVVSVDIPAVRAFEPLVRIACSVKEFIASIEDYLKCDHLVHERLMTAQRHSWDARIEAISNIISAVADRNG